MYLFYIDDSSDDRARNFVIFSAIAVPESRWADVFNEIKKFRLRLRTDYGIVISKELHAWKFLSGRGRPSERFLSRQIRATIFNDALGLLASLAPMGVRMLNVARNEDYAFERLINRINVFLRKQGEKGLLICDEGKEGYYTKLCRQMRAHNPIPSKYGGWANGKVWKSIAADNILEDPIFKKSHDSNFIQLADFCAFALLRRERPTVPMTALGIDKSFPILKPICVLAANTGDPLGVIR